MNSIKKIGLLLLISGLITGFAQAADKAGRNHTADQRIGRSRDRLELGERDADLQGEGLSDLRERPFVGQSRNHQSDRFGGGFPS